MYVSKLNGMWFSAGLSAMTGTIRCSTTRRSRQIGTVYSRMALWLRCLARKCGSPRPKRLLSSDRLVVDGTLVRARASHRSLKAKDGSDEDKPNFKGTKRSNETHSRTIDLDAGLIRKGNGQESMLALCRPCDGGCRHGHRPAGNLTVATGTVEVDADLAMVEECAEKRDKIVADRHYDQRKFIHGVRKLERILLLVPRTRAPS